jgi:hypothetical protein
MILAAVRWFIRLHLAVLLRNLALAPAAGRPFLQCWLIRGLVLVLARL